ncbi:helix-turn-helix domain-containing protein [Bacteroides pyogenes]|uniref:helix-turn-helix domain-containing protein n=1 Tax=Bacteroides pyogenes TaxID=310300 RepID=UPI001BA66A7A|nr:helix-turn-helix transcriptional regulator [Bacteroides pyogenes]MBR8726177.1 hypothetical protein [Bacteroides pyogenes]MBR8739556.1 hypothetical protein [Bacteroides pyogenes]MBR8755402.1 hypothetical protein [Bacteroides pyogenes]MBR8796670.1 hypothetical protein [Bacteroides pyogenes]MBR8810279.1 hypothetical protein [Bacteroides pyogenes]
MRIRDIIEKQGITTKEVADKLGISVSALNQNISGNPSVKVLEKISAALDVPMWQLFASPEEVAGGADFVAFIKDGRNIYHADSIEELGKIISEIKEKQGE